MSRHEAHAEKYRPMKATLGAAASLILGTAISNLYGSADPTTTFATSGVIFSGVVYLAEFFFGKRKNAENCMPIFAHERCTYTDLFASI